MNDPNAFVYEAGGQQLWGDPLELHLALTQALGNGANQVLKEARSTEEPATAATARLRLIASVRAAFQLPPYDPATRQGASAADCERILAEYLTFCGLQKKSTESAPTSPTPFPATL